MASHILKLGIRWRWVVRFTALSGYRNQKVHKGDC